MKTGAILLAVLFAFCLFHVGESKKRRPGKPKQTENEDTDVDITWKQACRNGWKKQPEKDICYRGFARKMTFSKADERCKKMGGQVWDMEAFSNYKEWKNSLALNKTTQANGNNSDAEMNGDGSTGKKPNGWGNKYKNRKLYNGPYWVNNITQPLQENETIIDCFVGNMTIAPESEQMEKANCVTETFSYGCQKSSTEVATKPTGTWKPTWRERRKWKKCKIDESQYWCNRKMKKTETTE